MAKDSMGTILTLGAVGIGGYFLYEWLTTPAAAATTPATPAAPPASSTSTSTSTMTPAKPSLSALATSIQNGAATDPNFSGSPLQGSGYRWQTYLNIALQSTGVATPATPAGLDLSQNMTFQTYWAAVAPTLTAAYGLAGLMGLMGYVARANGLGQDDESIVDPPGFTGPPTPDASGNIPTATYPASQSQLAALASLVPDSGATPSVATPSGTIMWVAIGGAALLGLLALTSGKR